MIDLPLILNGREYDCDLGAARYDFEYEAGLHMRMPLVSQAHMKNLKDAQRSLKRELAALSVYDIAQHLGKAAAIWYKRGTPSANELLRYTSILTGYSEEMVGADYDAIAHFISTPTNIYELVATELGNEKIMDEWLPTLSTYVKAFPHGCLLHYLVGNLPLASLFSIIRGVISRNINITKLPARDPFTTMAFMRAIIAVDPDSPISRSLSAVYWPHNANIEAEFLRLSDVICAWGGSSAISELKAKIPVGVPLLEYGPRWSASVIDLEGVDLRKVAYRLAADVGYYDQEACFSTQRVFVRGRLDPFLDELAHCFEAFSERFPKLSGNRDALAHRSASLLEYKYLGLDVREGKDWAIVIAPDARAHILHPLGRTLIVNPVQNFNDIEVFLDKRSQTLSVYPYSLVDRYRDDWIIAGASRIVELGTSRRPRQGFTHDGTRGLAHLVKFACIERPLGEHLRKDWKTVEELEANLFVIPIDRLPVRNEDTL